MTGRRKKDSISKNLADADLKKATTIHIPAEAPPMPEIFKGSHEMTTVWQEVVSDFDRMHILSRTDTGCIEVYCILIEQVRRMKKFLMEHGETYSTRTKNGDRTFKRPEYEILKDSMLRLKTYAIELGATPASRGKIPSLLQADLFGGKESNNSWKNYQ